MHSPIASGKTERTCWQQYENGMRRQGKQVFQLESGQQCIKSKKDKDLEVSFHLATTW